MHTFRFVKLDYPPANSDAVSRTEKVRKTSSFRGVPNFPFGEKCDAIEIDAIIQGDRDIDSLIKFLENSRGCFIREFPKPSRDD